MSSHIQQCLSLKIILNFQCFCLSMISNLICSAVTTPKTRQTEPNRTTVKNILVHLFIEINVPKLHISVPKVYELWLAQLACPFGAAITATKYFQ